MCVGVFTPDNFAGNAVSSTHALNAGQSIPQANATPQNRAAQQVPQYPEHPLEATVREPLSHGPTPVNPNRLTIYLKGYDDAISDYLLKGFVHHFSIRYFGSLFSLRSLNLKSATDNPTSVNDKLLKELTAGRIVGPFDVPPFKPFRVSPLGIVPKKSPGEFRLIHHLSYPGGFSVNDGIPKEPTSVRYATIDDAIGVINRLGKAVFYQKLTLSPPLELFLLLPAIFRCWEWNGKGNFTLTLAFPWGALRRVIYLKPSAPP